LFIAVISDIKRLLYAALFIDIVTTVIEVSVQVHNGTKYISM